MSLKRLFVNQPLQAGDHLQLDSESAHYLGRVLRARAGSDVMVFNGDGRQWQATIAQLERRRVWLDVISETDAAAEPLLKITLWQALSRNEKMDLVIQKSVELGVATIRPVIVERSVMQLDANRLVRRQAHWQSVAVHAAQQCGRCVVPEVETAVPLDVALQNYDRSGLAILASPDATPTLAELMTEADGTQESMQILVGPEGGFTAEEAELAVAKGFAQCRVGPRVLRTETAAIALLSIAQFQLGDLGCN